MVSKVSVKGLAETAGHEGIVTSWYLDSVGIPTIGIGHTKSAGDPNPRTVRGDLSINEIMDIFARDAAKFEARVAKAFTRPISQTQFDAAFSFDFNTGAINRASWVRHFNAGNDAKAKKSFMDWRKPAAIIPRRQKECDLFFKGIYANGGMANIYPATSSGKVHWSSGRRIDVLKLMNGSDLGPIVTTARSPITTPKPTQKPADAQKSRSKTTGLAVGLAVLGAAIAAKWDAFSTWIGGLF